MFKTKKNAQDAHEAIRPSMPELTPDQVKDSLTADQYKLYKLIWERFIASQMANALLDTISADIDADNCCTFKASGYSVKFDGFTVLYEEKNEDGEERSKKMLPPLKADDPLKVSKSSTATSTSHSRLRASRKQRSSRRSKKTASDARPPTPRPSRPFLTRMYVEREGKQLKPTALGEVTTELMKEHFKKIVDAKFTAEMETELDNVEQGKRTG